jgi:hypothetical protein
MKQGQGYCPKCKERVSAPLEDHGIGPYEVHGYKGVHHAWMAICPQCDTELEDWEPFEPEYERY